MAVGNVRDGCNVGDGQSGIARGFDVDELGIGADGSFHVGGVRGVHQSGFHAEFVVEQLMQQPVDGDIGYTGENHMVSLL